MKKISAIIVFTTLAFTQLVQAGTVIDCRYSNAQSSGIILGTTSSSKGIAQYNTNGGYSKQFPVSFQVSELDTYPPQTQVTITLEKGDKALMVNFFGQEGRGKGYLFKSAKARGLEMICIRR